MGEHQHKKKANAVCLIGLESRTEAGVLKKATSSDRRRRSASPFCLSVGFPYRTQVGWHRDQRFTRRCVRVQSANAFKSHSPESETSGTVEERSAATRPMHTGRDGARKRTSKKRWHEYSHRH